MLRATVAGSAYIGVFASVLGDRLLVRSDIDDGPSEQIAEELGVQATQTMIGGGTTVGSLVAGNRSGAVVSRQITSYELEQLTEALDRPIERLPGRLNAAGNLILANDTGAVVHPELSDDAVEMVEDVMSVPTIRASIGGIKTVGMAAVSTNAGVLCHPQATDDDLTLLDEHLGVHADIGTINHGSPLIGSGLLATTDGYVVGERTTGPELGRIEDALDLID